MMVLLRSVALVASFWIPVAGAAGLAATALMPFPLARRASDRAHPWVVRILAALSGVALVVGAGVALFSPAMALFAVLVPLACVLVLASAFASGWRLGLLVVDGGWASEHVWATSVTALAAIAVSLPLGLLWPPARAAALPILVLALASGFLVNRCASFPVRAVSATLVLVVCVWLVAPVEVSFDLRTVAPVPLIVLLGILPWVLRTPPTARREVSSLQHREIRSPTQRFLTASNRSREEHEPSPFSRFPRRTILNHRGRRPGSRAARRRSSRPFAWRSGGASGALTDHFALELGDGGDDVEREPPRGGRGVDAVADADEIDVAGAEIVEGDEEVADATGSAPWARSDTSYPPPRPSLTAAAMTATTPGSPEHTASASNRSTRYPSRSSARCRRASAPRRRA